MTDGWATSLNYFLQGAAAMGCAAAALFFVRYWRTTHDRFFLFLLVAFFALGLNWIGLAVVQPSQESTHWFYLLRLVAFASIIAAIVDKNRHARPPA